MNFRRQPFQFTTIDPVKRQAELQKRFGLPTTNSDMFVDFLNPGVMGSGIKEPSSLHGSPRLQHRVPIFTEKAAKGNSEQNNVDGNHKPRVRVIPIQVEGVDGGKRHRTFSGPAGMGDGNGDISKERLSETLSCLDSSKVDEKFKGPSQPRVCNIPIQIEPREAKSTAKVDSNPELTEKKPSADPTPESAKKLKAEPNGCAGSSQKKGPGKTGFLPLRQIKDVLNKLKLYTDEVEKFSGTSKDKQYRYLDEMLTRCMLDLDNVDTMGLDEVRKARKEAVKQVQHYVDLLDTKVNEPVEKMDIDFSSGENNLVADSKDEQMICDNPTEGNNVPNSDLNCNESKEVNECASGDALTEVINDAKDRGESCDIEKSNVTDVEMDEDKGLSGSVPGVTEDISAQDCSMENEELVDSAANKESMSPMHEPEMETVTHNEPDLGMKDSNKSEIVIEELDDSLENGFNVCSDANKTVSCVISESPELDVKDTIIEEGDSEIVIEEVEDSDEKDIEHSSDACDSSVDKVDSGEHLSVEQIKSDICDTDTDVSSCITGGLKYETDSK